MAIEAYGGLQPRLYLFLNFNARWSGQLQALATLLQGKELERTHRRYRQYEVEETSFPCRELNTIPGSYTQKSGHCTD